MSSSPGKVAKVAKVARFFSIPCWRPWALSLPGWRPCGQKVTKVANIAKIANEIVTTPTAILSSWKVRGAGAYRPVGDFRSTDRAVII
jgi:hypothetical protein